LIFAEINKIAMIGHNDKFGPYLEQSIRALDTNNKLKEDEKQRKRHLYSEYLK
jgi:hypothetical protein